MKRIATTCLAACVLAGCEEDRALVVGVAPAAPEDLRAWYYAGAVELAWSLGRQWDGEPFRVYAKREADAAYGFVAETTSCMAGRCRYRDLNVAPDVTYRYYVAAVARAGGAEASSREVAVHVPRPVPPPAPRFAEAVALDGAAYVRWDNAAASEEDFSLYAVYLDHEDEPVLLGETDSPGFIDFLAENGTTYAYFVTSIDEDGHESGGSPVAQATPRPDYAGEVVRAHRDSPGASGFRFTASDAEQAVVGGADPSRHFRVDARADELWIDLAEGVAVHSEMRATTALSCGPGADADCVSWNEAPARGYVAKSVRATAGFTMIFRVAGEGGQARFGAVRVESAGVDQDGHEFVVFDWAYQTQANNRGLDRLAGTGSG